MIIKLLVEGGNMKPGPAISQKLGPMGINMGKVIQDVNKATESFKGLKVPVDLDVDTATKSYTINVSSPPVAELIKKELGLEVGSGDSKKIKVGNLAIEQVISIAKTKYPNMLSKNLKAAVKSVVGSCVSLGVMVENKEAKETEDDISNGKYDKEINEEKTTADPGKLKEIKDYFDNLKKTQDERLKKEQEAKAAEEAAAAAKVTAGAAAPAAAAAPGAPAAPTTAAKEAKPSKPAAKK
jgi:large subunit ribosomal protein L11